MGVGVAKRCPGDPDRGGETKPRCIFSTVRRGNLLLPPSITRTNTSTDSFHRLTHITETLQTELGDEKLADFIPKETEAFRSSQDGPDIQRQVQDIRRKFKQVAITAGLTHLRYSGHDDIQQGPSF